MINPEDLTNAVIFDRGWLLRTAAEADLVATRILPPRIRGHQWTVHLARRAAGRETAAFPEDAAPRGLERPPLA
jgi:hypothetical protein